MKLPNGYGSVHKLPGNRRKPWRVRKTVGWDTDFDSGTCKQKYITIGYYPTQKEALQALADYNANPYDISTNTITFAEVYEKWSEIHFKTIVPSAIRTWKSAYNYCKPLYNLRMKDIVIQHFIYSQNHSIHVKFNKAPASNKVTFIPSNSLIPEPFMLPLSRTNEKRQAPTVQSRPVFPKTAPGVYLPCALTSI